MVSVFIKCAVVMKVFIIALLSNIDVLKYNLRNKSFLPVYMIFIEEVNTCVVSCLGEPEGAGAAAGFCSS